MASFIFKRLAFFLCLVSFDLFCFAAPIALDEEQVKWASRRQGDGLDAHFNLMPFPKTISWDSPNTEVLLSGLNEASLASFSALGPRQKRASDRFAARFTRVMQTNANYAVLGSSLYTWDTSSPRALSLNITCGLTIDIPALGDDESYTLELLNPITSDMVVANIVAPTSTGVLRAMVTMLQLICRRVGDTNNQNVYLPVGFRIDDAPVFPWRGLMVDVARRFHPVENLQRIMEGMESAKMNTLHLHLCDDQGWRFEMKGNKWDRLHTVGGEGDFYTQEQLKSLVQFGADRGIRVYPEFDMPGHMGAALYAYPSLNQFITVTQPVHTWGIFQYVLSPMLDSIYDSFVPDLINQSNSVFVDPFFHVGGDEVVWGQTLMGSRPWMQDNNVTDLHKYFNERAFPIIHASGKRVIGWQEIMNYAVPSDSVIQLWMGAAPISNAILSSGFYFDHLQDVVGFWLNGIDPTMMGAEVCAWSEWMGDNMDTRLFPMLHAASEMMWLGRDKVTTFNLESFRARLSSIDLGLRAFGVTNRAVFRTQVLAMVSNVKEWIYSQAVANLDIFPSDPVYDAVYMMTDLLGPVDRVNIGGPKVPMLDICDAARPSNSNVDALLFLIKKALIEELDPSKFHTKTLMNYFQRLVDMKMVLQRKSFTDPNVPYFMHSIAESAEANLAWLTTIQSNQDGEMARNVAITKKGLAYDQLQGQSNFMIINHFAQATTILLAVAKGPYNYTTPGATTTVTTTPAPTTTTTTTSTTPAPTTSTTTSTTRTTSTTGTTTTTTPSPTTTTTTDTTTTPTTSTTTTPASTTTTPTSTPTTTTFTPTTTEVSSTTTSGAPISITTSPTSDPGDSLLTTRNLAIGFGVLGSLLLLTFLGVAACVIIRRRRAQAYDTVTGETPGQDASNDDLFEDL